MAKSKSSGRWLQEHFDDRYVKLARQQGLRSRSIYKLAEIQERDRILRPGMVVVDLGAAPGGWSQLATNILGESGRLIALDLLPMAPLPGVRFLQGDFTEEETLNRLLEALGGSRADLVMSDLAPNISGVASVDQPRAMYLAELAADLAGQVLAPGGDILVKAFQGTDFDGFRRHLQRKFEKILTRKPDASRSRSREVYLLGRGYTR